MTAAQRRDIIRETLLAADAPISASALAARLGVSRQIVVGDVALLRAGGFGVDATPRGYRVQAGANGYTGMVACIHDPDEGMRTELYCVVDNGGTAEDVIVENPLYGELKARLHLTSRYEVDTFVARAARQPRGLLNTMTPDGVHLHTVTCPDKAAFDRICAALKENGILYEK